MGLSDTLKRMGATLTKLLGIGVSKAEMEVDKMKTPDVMANDLDHAIKARAQKTLGKVRAILTAYGEIREKTEMARADRDDWNEQVEDTMRAADVEADPAKKAELEKLALDASKQAVRAEEECARLEAALADSQDEYDGAIRMIEEAGASKEDALSQTRMLKIESFSAAAQKLMASVDLDDDDDSVPSLLAEFREQVQSSKAEAGAAATIAEHTPKSAEQIGRATSRLSTNNAATDKLASIRAKLDAEKAVAPA